MGILFTIWMTLDFCKYSILVISLYTSTFCRRIDFKKPHCIITFLEMDIALRLFVIKHQWPAVTEDDNLIVLLQILSKHFKNPQNISSSYMLRAL